MEGRFEAGFGEGEQAPRWRGLSSPLLKEVVGVSNPGSEVTFTCCRCRTELLQTHAASFVSPQPATTQTASRVTLRATASSPRMSLSSSWNQTYTDIGGSSSRTSVPRVASSSENGCGGTHRFKRRRPTKQIVRTSTDAGGVAVCRTRNEIHPGPTMCAAAPPCFPGRDG